MKKMCVLIVTDDIKILENIKQEYHSFVGHIFLHDLDTTSISRRQLKLSKIDHQISALLKQLGIPANITGYPYLVESLKIMIKNPSTVKCFSKDLYPYLAILFNRTPASIERAIRTAITTGWSRGDIDLMNNMFSFSFAKDKPTNSEYILTLLEEINKLR